MKVIVCIVVYNRFQNLERWLNIWEQCDQEAELIIIHTGDEIEKFKSLCEKNSVKYIHRTNQGFDIGCMQDVFKERLEGFDNDWNYLLWVTDDTFPLTKDFISPFINKIQEPGVGVSCMQISKAVSPHVRTTGFCISKELSKKIIFPADPITTKAQCYYFEHRGGMQTFTNQVRSMGLSCEQVAPNKISPLWDAGYWRRLDREAELEQAFPTGKKKGDKVVFICTIFNTYPQIISSLILQTHQNWQLILIHDGPTDNHGIRLQAEQDSRIKYIETKERTGNWGHSLRQWALNEIREGRLSDADYIVIQNADNYLTPPFTEYLLKGFNKSHTTVATYCSGTVHSYKNWQLLPAKLERGYLDCGAVMIKKEIACEVGWSNITEHSADWIFFSEIAARYSWKNFSEVSGILFVHN